MALYLGETNKIATLLSSDNYMLQDVEGNFLMAPIAETKVNKYKVMLNNVAYNLRTYTPKKEDE